MTRPRVLYIVYWGAAEPLGQSLVLPAIERLAAIGAHLSLVTFEKPSDLKRKDEMSRISRLLSARGVEWMPLSYHKRPKVPATVFDMAHGFARAIISGLKTRFDIVHARTFIGGLIGLAVAPALRAKLIYHNEGFYPDEQVDAGVWQEGSMPHRVAKRLERTIYSRADAIISMSDRGKAWIEKLSAVQQNWTPVIVVPSCVDLDAFRLRSPATPRGADATRFVYSGSVGGRYQLDRVARFVSVAQDTIGPVRLQILTRSDRGLVESMLRAGGLSDNLWAIDSVPYASMPGHLSEQQAGLHFLPNGLSDHGGSPTKIGEYWAVGIPVVATPNAGDTEGIIRRERVGVIVDEHNDTAYRKAALELRLLLDDAELPLRCRRAAETHYSLKSASERQAALYQTLALKQGIHENRALSFDEYSAARASRENKR